MLFRSSSQEPARGRKRRAPAWFSADIMDLIHDLRTRHRKVAIKGRIAASLATKGHMQTQEQVCMKIKVVQ